MAFKKVLLKKCVVSFSFLFFTFQVSFEIIGAIPGDPVGLGTHNFFVVGAWPLPPTTATMHRQLPAAILSLALCDSGMRLQQRPWGAGAVAGAVVVPPPDVLILQCGATLSTHSLGPKSALLDHAMSPIITSHITIEDALYN